MEILYKMADNGGIDSNIANDMAIALAPYDGIELPPPEI
jgi:hypothetical protein